jgi:hypothetical protein
LNNLKIVPTTLRKANDFVAVYHRHSLRTARNGGKFAIAVTQGTTVVGVAIVGNPLSATLMDGFTAEVLRTCVIPHAPKNCNSMLYGACRRIWFEMGGSKILTYTLTEETGASLRGAGWVQVAVIRGHNTTNWGKVDHLQSRVPQAIYGRTKHRWESINEKVDNLILTWPAEVSNMRTGWNMSIDFEE